MWKMIPQTMCVIVFVILNEGVWTSQHASLARKTLPIELQGMYMMSKILMHFCPDGRVTCAMPSECVRWLCCGGNSNQCSNNTDPSMCMEDDQVYVCGFRDAIVCQYEDGRGSCIYSNSSSRSLEPLCICKENGMWPTSDNHTSQIGRSCTGYETTTGSSGSSSLPTATSPMSDQTTETSAPQKSESIEVNTIAIVLGAILVIVLLVLLVVCLLKRRRNQTTPKKATTNTTNASVVSSAERAQIPELLVLGGVEYNYAYDHWSQSNATSDTGEPKPVNHTGGNRYEENEPSGSSSIAAGNRLDIREVPKYYELGQPQDSSNGGQTPQGPKYYELGQAIDAATSQENLQGPKFYELGQSCDAAKGGKTPQVPKYDEVRRRPHTEQIINEKTPHDPQHFVLEQSRDAANGGKTPQAPKYDEVRRRPHTEQRNIEKTPQDPKYFELEHPQDNDNETMFIAVDESVNPSPGGSSNQGYDQAYMPLKQSAKPVDSGYEPLQMPSSVAERNNAPSAYDHLNNKTGIRSQKVTPSEKDCDDQKNASLNI